MEENICAQALFNCMKMLHNNTMYQNLFKYQLCLSGPNPDIFWYRSSGMGAQKIKPKNSFSDSFQQEFYWKNIKLVKKSGIQPQKTQEEPLMKLTVMVNNENSSFKWFMCQRCIATSRKRCPQKMSGFGTDLFIIQLLNSW